jgi:N6-L-threonylcarbamoyladenine synthase
MIGGPYPGGKWIADLAQQGTYDERFRFHAGNIDGDVLAFSYSGLKSQVYNIVQKLICIDETDVHSMELDHQTKANIAYMFQEAIVKDLAAKTALAVELYGAKTIGICGGVSANIRLREVVEEKFQDISLLIPTKFVYCTDNAAMMGVVGILEG